MTQTLSQLISEVRRDYHGAPSVMRLAVIAEAQNSVIKRDLSLEERLAPYSISPAQQKTAVFIDGYVAEHGYAPTLQEIADAEGVSKVTIFERVTVLKRKGIVAQDRYVTRGSKMRV